MKSRSTGRLTGSELDQAVNFSKVRTELSYPTPGPLDNMGYVLVKICVEIED